MIELSHELSNDVILTQTLAADRIKSCIRYYRLIDVVRRNPRKSSNIGKSNSNLRNFIFRIIEVSASGVHPDSFFRFEVGEKWNQQTSLSISKDDTTVWILYQDDGVVRATEFELEKFHISMMGTLDEETEVVLGEGQVNLSEYVINSSVIGDYVKKELCGQNPHVNNEGTVNLPGEIVIPATVMSLHDDCSELRIEIAIKLLLIDENYASPSPNQTGYTPEDPADSADRTPADPPDSADRTPADPADSADRSPADLVFQSVSTQTDPNDYQNPTAPIPHDPAHLSPVHDDSVGLSAPTYTDPVEPTATTSENLADSPNPSSITQTSPSDIAEPPAATQTDYSVLTKPIQGEPEPSKEIPSLNNSLRVLMKDEPLTPLFVHITAVSANKLQTPHWNGIDKIYPMFSTSDAGLSLCLEAKPVSSQAADWNDSNIGFVVKFIGDDSLPGYETTTMNVSLFNSNIHRDDQLVGQCQYELGDLTLGTQQDLTLPLIKSKKTRGSLRLTVKLCDGLPTEMSTLTQNSSTEIQKKSEPQVQLEPGLLSIVKSPLRPTVSPLVPLVPSPNAVKRSLSKSRNTSLNDESKYLNLAKNMTLKASERKKIRTRHEAERYRKLSASLDRPSTSQPFQSMDLCNPKEFASIISEDLDSLMEKALHSDCSMLSLSVAQIVVILENMGREVHEPTVTTGRLLALDIYDDKDSIFSSLINFCREENIVCLDSSALITQEQIDIVINGLQSLIKGPWPDAKRCILPLCRGASGRPSTWSTRQVVEAIGILQLKTPALELCDGAKLLSIDTSDKSLQNDYLLSSSILRTRFRIYLELFRLIETYRSDLVISTLRKRYRRNVLSASQPLPANMNGFKTDPSCSNIADVVGLTQLGFAFTTVLMKSAERLLLDYIPLNKIHGWGAQHGELEKLSQFIGGETGTIAKLNERSLHTFHASEDTCEWVEFNHDRLGGLKHAFKKTLSHRLVEGFYVQVPKTSLIVQCGDVESDTKKPLLVSKMDHFRIKVGTVVKVVESHDWLAGAEGSIASVVELRTLGRVTVSFPAPLRLSETLHIRLLCFVADPPPKPASSTFGQSSRSLTTLPSYSALEHSQGDVSPAVGQSDFYPDDAELARCLEGDLDDSHGEEPESAPQVQSSPVLDHHGYSEASGFEQVEGTDYDTEQLLNQVESGGDEGINPEESVVEGGTNPDSPSDQLLIAVDPIVPTLDLNFDNETASSYVPGSGRPSVSGLWKTYPMSEVNTPDEFVNDSSFPDDAAGLFENYTSTDAISHFDVHQKNIDKVKTMILMKKLDSLNLSDETKKNTRRRSKGRSAGEGLAHKSQPMVPSKSRTPSRSRPRSALAWLRPPGSDSDYHPQRTAKLAPSPRSSQKN